MRVPKNLEYSNNQVNVVALPEDCDIYKEQRDPVTGKTTWKIETKVVTIIDPKINKNIHLKPENQIMKKEVQKFKNPIDYKLKKDFENLKEEQDEEEII